MDASSRASTRRRSGSRTPQHARHGRQKGRLSPWGCSSSPMARACLSAIFLGPRLGHQRSGLGFLCSHAPAASVSRGDRRLASSAGDVVTEGEQAMEPVFDVVGEAAAVRSERRDDVAVKPPAERPAHHAVGEHVAWLVGHVLGFEAGGCGISVSCQRGVRRARASGRSSKANTTSALAALDNRPPYVQLFQQPWNFALPRTQPRRRSTALLRRSRLRWREGKLSGFGWPSAARAGLAEGVLCEIALALEPPTGVESRPRSSFILAAVCQVRRRRARRAA